MHSKNRKLIVFILILGVAGLGLFQFVQKNGVEIQDNALKTQQDYVTIQTETPYDAIHQYYKALEGNNWDLVKALTTPSLWNYIETSSFRSDWEKRIAQDPTLKFILFIVKKQSIDEDKGKGWVLGKVDWTSERRNVPDDNRTVFVEKRGRSWVISRVVALPAVEVVDDFYEAINLGDFSKAEELTTRSYWNKLNAAGIIRQLKKDRSRFYGGVYVVFLMEDFSEKPEEAWVSGDVSWKPLTLQQKEVDVNVHVVKENGWKIDNIVGDWDIKK